MSHCYLIDTCALLWANGDPERLSEKAKELLGDSGQRILVSQATIWELSIKVTVGKLKLPTAFFKRLPDLGYETLVFKDDHFTTYRQLPLLHRDPFDRMLAAQLISERIPVITSDSAFSKYEVDSIW